MARKPQAPSYAGMTLQPAAADAEVRSTDPSNGIPPRPPGRTLKEASAPHMIYLHPAAAKALKRYAIDQNTKVHDLLLEALEDWFRRHGLREPVRADTAKSRESAKKQP